MKKKYRWNVKKFIANMSLLVAVVLVGIMMVIFFGAPYFHMDSETYVNTMTSLTYISIPISIIAIGTMIVTAKR